jgi:hypothetical protein
MENLEAKYSFTKPYREGIRTNCLEKGVNGLPDSPDRYREDQQMVLLVVFCHNYFSYDGRHFLSIHSCANNTTGIASTVTTAEKDLDLRVLMGNSVARYANWGGGP